MDLSSWVSYVFSHNAVPPTSNKHGGSLLGLPILHVHLILVQFTMNHNFGGNNNQRPQFPGFAGQNFAGMQHFPQQGLQGQPYQQPAMNAGYQQMQANQPSYGQFPGNMPSPQMQQMYMQQQQQPQQYQHHPQQQQQQYHQQQYQQQQQQYQKMIEQQQKIALEQQKKEMELRKKRDFEVQQKRLQQLGAQRKSGGAGGDLSHLIGSLAQRNTEKQSGFKHQVVTPSGRSFFARPGTSYPPPPESTPQKDHHSQPDLTGQQIQRPNIEPTGMSVPGMIAASEVFGSQNTKEDDFSDFQEAQPSFSNQSTISTAANNVNAGWSLQTANPSMPGQPSHGISWQSNPGTNTSSSSVYVSPATSQIPNKQRSQSLTTQYYPGHVLSEPIQRDRADSQSSISSTSSSGIQPGMAFPDQQQVMSSQFLAMDGRHGQPVVSVQQRLTSNLAERPALIGQSFSSQQDIPGQMNIPEIDGSNVDIKEESEEEKLLRLYEITIPAWCREDNSLPGVYKDVKEAVTKNGAIDTGSLYPILLASDLQRDILGQIWNRVNKSTPGQLNDLELKMVLGLVALGQTGLKVERLTLEKLSTCKSAPIPTIPESVLKPSEGSWSFQKETSMVDKVTITPASQPSPMPLSQSNHPSTVTETLNTDTTKEEFAGFAGWSGQNVFHSTASSSILGAQISSHTSGLTMPQSIVHTIQSTTTNALEGEIKPALSRSPEFQEFQSASVLEEDDFGEFHGSASTVKTTNTSSHSTKTDLKNVTSLVSSLESFKLQTSSSLFTTSVQNNDASGTKLTDVLHENKNQNDSPKDKTNVLAFPAILKPPSSIDVPQSSNISNLNDNWSNFTTAPTTGNKLAVVKLNSTTSVAKNNENKEDGNLGIMSSNNTPKEKPSDKYDLLRDIDSDESSSIFSSSQPSRKKDDSFGDFEGFEMAESNNDGKFGDFQSSTFEPMQANSNSDNTSNVDESWNAFASVSAGKERTNFAQSDLAPITSKADDFGDFSQPQISQPSVNPSSSTNSNTSIFLSNQTTGQGSVTRGFNDSPMNSSSLATFTSGVPLDSAQRYKQLCGEEEDADQHGHVWGRCLNSCLLTLATCALAVQTMSDATIKQEILQTKKGTEYFKAIIEVFKVTKRIQASLIKTDFFSEKLKDIMEEITQTWKNIANFLAGTNLEESSTIKENFTGHHVQADEDKMVACGLCLLNVTKATNSKIAYGGREYHSTCANFWCNRVDSILPSLWPVNSLI